MTTSTITALRDLLTGALPSPNVTADVRSFLAGVNAAALEDILVHLAALVPISTIGYVLLPAINDLQKKQSELIVPLLNCLLRSELNLDFRCASLDFIGKITKGDPQVDKGAVFAALQKVAISETSPPLLRAKAVRLLGLNPGPETEAVLAALLADRQPLLVNAVADAMRPWRYPYQAHSFERLLPVVLQYIKSDPKDAIRCPGLLRLLLLIPEQLSETLPYVVDAAESPDERDRLLSAIGDRLPADYFARMIRSAIVQPLPETNWIIRSLLQLTPSHLKALHESSHYLEYLYCSDLVPLPDQPGELQRLKQLMRASDPVIRSAAERLVSLDIPTEIAEPALKPTGDDGFETGIQPADAIYVSLSMAGPLINDHWHAGLFLGFEGTRAGTGTFSGLHVDQLLPSVNTFFASLQFTDPTLDLSTQVRKLREKFIQIFTEGRAFHGPRNAPSVSREQRRRIVATALAMHGRSIWWTFANMLEYYGLGWDGDLDDIYAIRCDGVIEYSYEKNGVRVCGGTDPNAWNIAAPTIRNADNHNDFHTYEYDHGELCPRIQAGDLAHAPYRDTTFVIPSSGVPGISVFQVVARDDRIEVVVSISAPASYHAYARLLVRSRGEDLFHILRTAHPPGGLSPIEGPWYLMRLRANTRSPEIGIWDGATAEGHSYWGQNGGYEFLLQVIDEGGNVSPTYSVSAEITWKGEAPMSNLDDVHVVRPNLGNPLILLPTALKEFEVTLGGTATAPPNPEELLSLLRTSAKPLSLVRRPIDGGSSKKVRLNVLRVHSLHLYSPFTQDWTKGVLPVSNEDHQYVAGFRWEYKVSVGLDDSQIRMLADRPWRTPLDLESHSKTCFQSVYVHEQLPVTDSLTMIHITDLHIARRNDRIPEVLAEVRTCKENIELRSRYVNFNNNLRAVVAYANRLVRQDTPVVVVATGDLVDFYVDGEGKGFFLWSAGKAKASRSNFLTLLEIITGRDGKGEPLQCPIFTVLGNHDYLIHEPPLDFDVNLWGTPIELTERSSCDSFGLTPSEGREFDYWNAGCPPVMFAPGATATERRKVVKQTGMWQKGLDDDEAMWLTKPRVDHMSTYLKHVNYDLDFTCPIGHHQLVFFNTGPDRCPTKEEIFAETTLGNQGSHVKDFIGGGSHTRGITAQHLAHLSRALKDTVHTGLVLAFGHAPLINFPGDQVTGTERLFESSRPDAKEQPPNAITKWLGTYVSWGWRPIPIGGKVPPPHTASCLGSPKTALESCAACRENAAEYFSKNGYPQFTTPYFKIGGRDSWIDFQCADGQVGEFFELAAPNPSVTKPVTGSAQRKLTAYFAGHTHQAHEFRVAHEGPKTASQILLYIDNYSGSRGKPETGKSLTKASDKTSWLQQHAPFLITSETSKRRLPKFREIQLRKDSIESLRVVELPAGSPLSGTERLVAAARHYLLGNQRPCEYILDTQEGSSRQREKHNLLRDLEECLKNASNLDTLNAELKRKGLADAYTNISLWFNSFGVDFGTAARNSMEDGIHRIWATSAKFEDIVEEVAIRVDRLIDFTDIKTGPNNLMCAWYTHESMILAKIAGFDSAGRNSLDPRVHMQWALGVNCFISLQELQDKYKYQFDRLYKLFHDNPKRTTPFLDVFAEAMVRFSAWGARCDYRGRFPSVNPANYLDLFRQLSYDKEQMWKLVNDSFYSVASAILLVELEAK